MFLRRQRLHNVHFSQDVLKTHPDCPDELQFKSNLSIFVSALFSLLIADPRFSVTHNLDVQADGGGVPLLSSLR